MSLQEPSAYGNQPLQEPPNDNELEILAARSPEVLLQVWTEPLQKNIWRRQVIPAYIDNNRRYVDYSDRK